VVPHQPDRPPLCHELPGQIHGYGDLGAAVDHIAAEDESVLAGKKIHEVSQRLAATMNIADDPVIAATRGNCKRHLLRAELNFTPFCEIALPRNNNQLLSPGGGGIYGSLSEGADQGVTKQGKDLVDPRSLSVAQRVWILFRALDGAKRTN